MGLFKTYSEKEVKRVRPIVEKINSLEPAMKELSDSELVAKTPYFKEQLKNGKTLDDILPEAFAVVREASRRVLGMRHFDVQLIGGIILHQGRIAEMKTGEGKTLVATLPVYLNALTGEGVHVITVNDYLAKRDSEWMGNLYRFLGLSVGLVIAGMNPKQKQEAYACDVTYGTNNEFGFDYLRDNMVIYKNQLVQRKLKYAIVDEIDSILIDEARTPLIISGRGAQSSNLYQKADHFVKKLQAKVIIEEDDKDYEQEEDNEKYDYIVDLKAKSATLTQQGIKKAEQEFGLENFNDLENSELVHDVNQALHANGIMKKDKDYIVIPIDLINNPNTKIIFDKIKPLVDEINSKRKSKGLKERKARILIMGVPNVGKSTLINRLVGRKATNVGNRPGVTKNLEWIRINDKVELLDTPGILWPKLDEEEVAYNLASMTAIKEEVLDSEDIAIYIIKKLLSDYPDNIINRYNLTKTEDIVDILDEIGKKIGAFRNSETDYDRVYKRVIKDLQDGYLGNITFDNIN